MTEGRYGNPYRPSVMPRAAPGAAPYSTLERKAFVRSCWGLPSTSRG